DIHIEREASFTNDLYYHYMLNEVSRFNDDDSIEIASTVTEDYLNKCSDSWYRQESLIFDMIYRILVFVVIAMIMLIYLICVCGKNKDGELKPMWVDNVWLEVHLAVIGFIGFFALYIIVVLMDAVFTGQFPKRIFDIIEIFATVIASSAILTSLLSIIRNIKRKNFIGSSIIMRIIRWCFKTAFSILRWLRKGFVRYRNLIFKTLSKKTGIILITMLLIYTALIGFFGIVTPEAPFFLLVAIAVFGFASFVVAYRAKDLDEIKKGVSEIRNGNVAYKIPELKSEDMKALATNINDIAKGLDESVSAKVKAERLKTELITNVSHDLKTPITSIISYTELLSKIEELPEEAKDYVSVISKKSERLKNLTQDLFDISKVQSGNEDVVLEKLDVALLINQSLGENNREIQKSEIPFCVDTPKELYISADGRKMSRVISNLINNILKYTLKNTRVFITAFEKDGEIVMEFKNIASYPMNFNADEIAGRFVRGDESRTAEGNGLGLAIAKSYTEICNGKFDIVIDGDMFKVIMKFKKIR
ncbi:MAG: HAMP domain-containing histidine kinase, partial [Clostridia bacterium]|nr:HAMP domain-containing histidine kinase [Clostridia bacterium]